MLKGARLLYLAVCIAGLLNFGLTTVRLVDSPLRFDETEFASQAAAITRHGVPKIPYGETGRIPTPKFREKNGQDAQYGMWHPPLYLYSLALSTAVFGKSNWAFRSVGLAWFVLSILVVWRATRDAPDRVDTLERAFPWALMLLSPLVAQGIFYLDIDNTSLGTALILFGVTFTVNPRDCSWRRALLLSAVLFLALWSKLTTPVIALIAVAVYHLLDGRLRDAIMQPLVIGALSAVAFGVTYLAFCRVMGYPADFMFRFTYLGKQGQYSGSAMLLAKAHAIWWNVIWFSPALSLLFGLMTFDRMRHWWARRRLEPVDFWIIFAWGCFGAYAVWGAIVGKYTFPAAVAVAIALGYWLPANLRGLKWRRAGLLAAAFTVLLALQIALVSPLQLKAPSAGAAQLSLQSGLLNPRNVSLVLTVMAIGAFALVASYSVSGGTLAGRFAALVVTSALAINSVESFKIMRSPDDRSPYRVFSERGFEATVGSLNEGVSDADILLVPKDMGYYLRSRHYDIDLVRDHEGAAAIAPLVRLAPVTRAADSLAEPALPDLPAILAESGLNRSSRIGDFAIYDRTR